MSLLSVFKLFLAMTGVQMLVLSGGPFFFGALIACKKVDETAFLN